MKPLVLLALIALVGCAADQGVEVLADDLPSASSQRKISAPPPLPAWWFDEPVERPGTYSVCLQATADTLDDARFEIGMSVLSILDRLYPDDPFHVNKINEEMTLLEGGRVRIAAHYDIMPKDTDG